MRISGKFSTIILCLLVCAVCLFLVNILLIFKYNNQYNDLQKNQLINQDSYFSIDELPRDRSGLYFIHKNFIKPERNSYENDLVLVSHCTGNHLHHLAELTQKWNGPVSIAVFIPGDTVLSTLSTLYLLYRCFHHIRHQVSIHLVYPATDFSQNVDLKNYLKKAEEINAKVLCREALGKLKHSAVFGSKNYAAKVAYPNNLLRNIVKRSVKEKYSLVVDIDMIPNPELRNNFITFAVNNKLFENGNSFYNGKSVFVLPAFEINISSSERLPNNKRELQDLENSGKVRPFYYDICWKCQKTTDYERWRNLEIEDSKIDVGYEVKWKDPWEPFFIASKASVDYDERFKQYGFNRVSHACELHVAGFKFFILDGGFLLHQGFKKQGSFHSSKDEENERNKLLFRTFKNELKTKYPNSRNRCY